MEEPTVAVLGLPGFGLLEVRKIDGEFAQRVVEVLADTGLRFVAIQDSHAHDQAARLSQGESLYVEREA